MDRARCIGCGLCVTGCPNDAARLERKAEAEIVLPPVDFAAWEQERLHNRGLDELIRAPAMGEIWLLINNRVPSLGTRSALLSHRPFVL